MNNIEEYFSRLHRSSLCTSQKCEVYASDLRSVLKSHSSLIAQLEAAQKELSAVNEKLSKPVELSSYWIEPASVWNDDEPTMPVDEVIKAIKAAGFKVEGNADA